VVLVRKNDMKVRRRKRGVWSGKSESGFYAVIHSLGTPLPPTGRMTQTRMMERPFLRTRKSKLIIVVWIVSVIYYMFDTRLYCMCIVSDKLCDVTLPLGLTLLRVRGSRTRTHLVILSSSLPPSFLTLVAVAVPHNGTISSQACCCSCWLDIDRHNNDSIRRGQNPAANPTSKNARCATYQCALLRVLPADQRPMRTRSTTGPPRSQHVHLCAYDP